MMESIDDAGIRLNTEMVFNASVMSLAIPFKSHLLQKRAQYLKQKQAYPLIPSEIRCHYFSSTLRYLQ